MIGKTDGTTLRYCLNELPRLSFQASRLYVAYQGNTESFAWNEIASYAYVTSEQTSLQHAEHDKGIIATYHDDRLTIFSKEAEMLTIYTLGGNVLKQQHTEADAATEIRYADFATGTYLVKCGQHTFKFIAR